MRFSKGHGLGNDYLVIERADLPWELTAARVRVICDRHHGIGSDGVMVADTRESLSLRIYNPDGSEAEKSGNGLRIFGAWLYGRGYVQRNEWFAVQLIRDTVRMRVEEELAGGALLIRAALGRASFDGSAVGFTPKRGEVRDYPLDLGGEHYAQVNSVSLSNPHCVVFVDHLSRADFEQRAPRICTHAVFSAGTNVQFVRAIDRKTIEIMIWERGVGETLASGSSASAAAAAAVRHGRADPGQITVKMAGGTAEVEVSPEFDVVLVAPAQIVYDGMVRPDVALSW